MKPSVCLVLQTDESLRIQCRNLSEELDSQRNLHRTTLKRATQAEELLKEAQQRVSGLEGELLTSDVERDRLKDAKRKVRASQRGGIVGDAAAQSSAASPARVQVLL